MKHNNKFFQSKPALFFAAILFVTINSFNLAAQNSEKQTRKARKADNLFVFSEYNKALPIYLRLVEKNPTSFTYNFRAGMCYLFSNMETFKCLDYFDAAKKNISKPGDSIPDLFYFSGHAYHLANRLDKAIESFNISKSLVDINDSIDISFIDTEIEQCRFGKKLMQTPTEAKLFNLGPNVNSIYPDYAAVVSPDYSMLIFTSPRKEATGHKLTPEGNYYEDIFISRNQANDWDVSKKIDSSYVKPNFFANLFSPAKSIGSSINTKEHDASISLSNDGKKLFLYRFNAVWQSEIADGKWGKPLKLNDYINGRNTHESSVSLTEDENTLYFVSERDGGYGGKDIYKSLKQADGNWGPAENLGESINTEFDEEAPFIDPKDHTLYFSSQGHNTMGGFDVFKTRFENNMWTTPENIGYPINSGADDVFYTFNEKRNKGFISTMRTDGIGNFDIYLIRYPKPLKVILATSYSGGLIQKDYKATVADLKSNESTSLFLNKTNDLSYKSKSNYKILIPEYNSENRLDTFQFNTPESYGDFSCFQGINYDIVKNYNDQLIGYKTTFYSPLIDIDAEIKKTNNGEKKFASKDEEYSAFVKTLKPDNDKIQIFSHINYVDTSSFVIIAAEKAAAIAKENARIAEETAMKSEKMQNALARAKKEADLAVVKAEKLKAKALASGTASAKEAAEKAENDAIAAKAKETQMAFAVDSTKAIAATAVTASLATAQVAAEKASVLATTVLETKETEKENAEKAAVAASAAAEKAKAIAMETGTESAKREAKVADSTAIAAKAKAAEAQMAAAKSANIAKTAAAAAVSAASAAATAASIVTGSTLTGSTGTAPDSKSLVLVENKNISIAGNLFFGKPPKPIANTKVNLVNEKGEIVQTTVTNDIGSFAFTNLSFDKNFLIKGEENDIPLSYNTKIRIMNKGGKEIQTTQSGSKGSFEFSFLTTAVASVGLFNPLYFEFAKYSLSPEAKSELESVFTYLTNNKNKSLEIIGHTDSKGSDEYNLRLSQNRASGIKHLLVQKGINSKRIKSVGMGKAMPVAPNENTDKSDNPEGRKLNRRVEFKVVNDK